METTDRLTSLNFRRVQGAGGLWTLLVQITNCQEQEGTGLQNTSSQPMGHLVAEPSFHQSSTRQNTCSSSVPSPPEPFMDPCTQCNAGVGARNKQGSSFPTSPSFLDCSALSAALIPSLCCRGTTIHIYDEGDGSPGPWLAEQSTSSPTQAKVLLY